jgi:hypothetical protein
LSDKYTAIQFWGKVKGEQKDYLILQAVTLSGSIEKQYLFSDNSGLSFSYLPGASNGIQQAADSINTPFTGNSAYKYTVSNNTTAKTVTDSKQTILEEKYTAAAAAAEKGFRASDSQSKSVTFNELERLAVVVAQIESETALVPLGAYYFSASGQVTLNDEYNGIPLTGKVAMSNVQLFKDPEQQETIASLRKQGQVNTFDCFDTVPEGTPWIVKTGTSGLKATIKTLLWPGFEFKMTLGAPDYSRAYFGSGLKNNDVRFMA